MFSSIEQLSVGNFLIKTWQSSFCQFGSIENIKESIMVYVNSMQLSYEIVLA